MAKPGMTESILPVPRTLFKDPFGFSIDIGGSCTKLAFYDVTDTDNGSEVINVHLLLFAREETESVCEVLGRKFSLPGNPLWETCTAYTTGTDGRKYTDIFKEKLGVRIEYISEKDCFVKAFQILRRELPMEVFVMAKSEEALESARSRMELSMKFRESLANTSKMKVGVADEEELSQEADVDYPCGLCMVGSGAMLMKIEESGEFETVNDNISCGGRQYTGLGSILTGGMNYTELAEAAGRGTIDPICTMSNDYSDKAGDKDANLYSMIKKAKPFPLFMFGKTVGKSLDTFSRDDLACAWTNVYVRQIGQVVPLQAKAQKLKKIFFMGNYFNHQVIRDILTESLTVRLQQQLFKGMEFDVVRHGGHYGAIGALLTNSVPSIAGQPTEATS